jgi:hypothetical protein
MVIITLQQIIDERISFLKEQINPQNKAEENKTFQLQIDAIRSASASYDDIEEVEAIIAEKKALLKNSKDVYETDRLFAELEGLEWLTHFFVTTHLSYIIYCWVLALTVNLF